MFEFSDELLLGLKILTGFKGVGGCDRLGFGVSGLGLQFRAGFRTWGWEGLQRKLGFRV